MSLRILYAALDQVVPGTLGGSTHVHAVAHGLALRGHDVHVLTSPGPDGFPDDGVHWHSLGSPLGMRQLRLARTGTVARLARRLKPDAVIERYYNFGGEGLRAARTVGALAVLEVNAPVVDYPGSPKRTLDRALLVEPMRRWREWQCRLADLFITPTAAILPDWIPPARIVEIEWGVDIDRFHPGASGPLPFARQPGTTVAIFAGAFRSWHGAIHVVRAIKTLRERGQHGVHAVLIGEGPELTPTRQAAAGVPGIVFTGPVPHAQMPACLAAADIGLAPFDQSAHKPLALGFYWSPLKVFEYMASGLPVVAPRLDRLSAIVRDGIEGVLYESTNPDGLAGALERLADPLQRQTLGRAGRARAVAEFSWAAHCARLDTVISAAIEVRRRTGAGACVS